MNFSHYKLVLAIGFDITGFGLINAYDAVFGPVEPASVPFEEDFEDGDLPMAFETNTNGADRIQVTTENDPIGQRHCWLMESLSLMETLS